MAHLRMADQKTKIGWNLPECDPATEEGHCHPSAPHPELVPNLPRIPNCTGTTSPSGDQAGAAYTYGCCAPPPSQEVSTQQHILGRPINAFLSPSNKDRAQLDEKECWIKGSDGSIPAGAIEGGQEADGEPLYVARAEYEGSLTPGKLSGSSGCHIPWGSAERKVDSYEVLCGVKGSWVRSDRDKVPDGALKGGYAEDGEILYVGRANHKGHMTPGKVHPSHKVCYVPYGGKEMVYQAYEVFVVDDE